MMVGRWAVAMAGAVVVVLGFLSFWLRLEGAYFLQDDFLNLAQVEDRGVSVLEFLARPDFGRFAPTHRLIHLVLWQLGGQAASWPLLRATLALLGTACGVLLSAVVHGWLRDSGAPGRTAAVLAAGAGLAVVVGSPLMSALVWAAAAFHSVVALACVLGAVVVGRRALRSGGWMSLAGAVTLWAAALGAYEKTLVLFPALLGVELAVQRQSRPLVWRRVALLAGAVGLVVVAFLGHSAAHGLGRVGPPPSAAALLDGLGRGVRQTWSVLLGVPPPLGPVVTAGLAGLTVLAARRWRQTLAVWGAAVALALALVILPGMKRVPEIGAAWGEVPRYFLEWWPLFLVTSALAIHLARPRFQTPLIALWGILLAVTVSRHWDIARRWVVEAHSGATRQWVEALGTVAAQPLAEAEVPGFVVERWYHPYSRVVRVARLFHPGASPADVEGVGVTAEGRVTWRRFQETEAARLTAEAGTCVVREGCFEAPAGSSCRAPLAVERPASPAARCFTARVDGGGCAIVVSRPTELVGIDGVPRCQPDLPLWVCERQGLTVESIILRLGRGERACVSAARWGTWEER